LSPVAIYNNGHPLVGTSVTAIRLRGLEGKFQTLQTYFTLERVETISNNAMILKTAFTAEKLDLTV
jgi:hypothetical protein